MKPVNAVFLRLRKKFQQFFQRTLFLPSAHKAHPEYEFKTVITTGISAPPIAEVNVTPMMLERSEVAPENQSIVKSISSILIELK